MFGLVSEPPRVDQLFALIANYDPDHLPLIYELMRNVFRADEECRSHGALLARELEKGDPDYGVLARLYLEASRAQAHRLWSDELASLSEEDLARHVSSVKGNVLWGLAEILALEGRNCLPQSLSRGLALTDLASQTARRVPLLPQLLTENQQEQLLGLTLAFQANALRALDRTPEAAEFFEEALRPFGGVDTFDFLPTILSLRASLEIAQRNYFCAFKSLTFALKRTGDPSQKARIHLKRSVVWGHVNEEFRALKEVERASGFLAGIADSQLHYHVTQSRAAHLSQMGRIEEAADLLPELRGRLELMDSPQETLHVRWVEARVAVGQERGVKGETLYRSVREGFLKLKPPYRAAVVTVELARHLFQQSRFQEVAHLAAESVNAFRRQGVEQEILGAVALLEDAHRGQLSLEIVGQILKRMQRAARER